MALSPSLRTAAADTVQLPEGGVPVKVIAQGVLCGPVAPGWALEGDNRTVTPPRQLPEGASRQFAIRVAGHASECGKSEQSLTLVATGKWPVIDAAGVTYFPGEGRLELRGRNLKGAQVTWPQSQDGQARWAVESCLEPSTTGKTEVCTVPVGRELGANPDLFWLPPFANPAEDAVIHDELGNRVARERLRLRPARVVLPGRIHGKDGVDIAHGPGLVPLLYPEAVAAVDCGLARCELNEKGVVVRAVPGPATSVAMRLRLAPRVFVMDKGELATEVTLKLPLLSCPVSVASGPPLRDVSRPRVVVRMDPGCGAEAGGLAWAVSGEPATVQRVQQTKEAVFVLLAAERITRDKVTITAARTGIDAAVIASVTEATIAVPSPRASLELENHGKVTFIPTNRDAIVTVAPAGDSARFVLVPLAGAYTVATRGAAVTVRGDENAGGFASLNFGYRVPSLPPEFAGTDLAVVAEPVQRQVRQASVPAPFGATGTGNGSALVDFLCNDKHGKVHRVPPGKLFRVDLAGRESCRVVIHRERLREEDGLQEVVLEVEVTRADGSPRGGASMRERLVLRPGAEPKIFWVRGVDQFDRISVRLTHVVDEERYVLSPTTRAGLPSAQWAAVVEGGRLRLYATAAIPAGLFRVNEPSGELRLNFGVLSRLTWLDENGREALFGLELGVVGLGLIPSRGIIANYPPTLAPVAGLGVRVPLGSGAAVGVHAWVAYEFNEGFEYKKDANSPAEKAGNVAFIFGPSISIGNVGTNL